MSLPFIANSTACTLLDSTAATVGSKKEEHMRLCQEQGEGSIPLVPDEGKQRSPDFIRNQLRLREELERCVNKHLRYDASTGTVVRASLDSTTSTVATEQDDEDTFPYYEEEGWIPRMPNGKQRTPNQIRNELQRYIDKTPGVTQTSMARQLGVSGNTMVKFMNPKYYKDPWNALQGGAYWEAARFLERERNKPKKTATKKRPTEGQADAKVAKKTKADAKANALALMQRIVSYEAPEVSEQRVYDSCPELVKKCKAFLAQDGVTKAEFCRALGGINANSLNPFLMSKKQDKAGCIVYPRAWVFFEKKRLMEGQPKSNARIKNEANHPTGFSLESHRNNVWLICPR